MFYKIIMLLVSILLLIMMQYDMIGTTYSNNNYIRHFPLFLELLTTLESLTMVHSTLMSNRRKRECLRVLNHALRHGFHQATCYISFLLSSFYRLSRHSNSAPDATSFLTDYSSTCYTFHIYTYFQFQVFFLMFLTFTCAPVHPSTCFHFSFHAL